MDNWDVAMVELEEAAWLRLRYRMFRECSDKCVGEQDCHQVGHCINNPALIRQWLYECKMN